MTVKSAMRPEDALIDHAVSTRYEDLPQDVVDYCKRLIMDTLGVSFPGSKAPGVSETIGVMASWACPGGATVLIDGTQTTPPAAALANSTLMHALDFDDTLDASALHTFVCVLPAALAAAESCDRIDGRQFITALTVGVDIICRISLAIQTPLSWIRTATCGGFGAAAAAGKIIGLDREAMANALGVVYSQTSGNAQCLLEGKLIKRMQPGFAASAGVTSAFLAKKGITGSRHFLTGTYGYYSLYERGRVDIEPVLNGLGNRWAMKDLSIKPYPSCRMTHSAIDAAIALRGELDQRWDDIERIDVRVSKMVTEMVGKPFVVGINPQVDAQFSIPYTVCCALVRGEVFLDDFETDAISDRCVRRLADRVHVSVDSDLPEKDLLQAKLTVRMNSGQRFEHLNTVPLGNPAKAMDILNCKEKLKKCVRYSRLNVDASRMERLFSLIEDLEHISDIRRLIDVMTLPKE